MSFFFYCNRSILVDLQVDFSFKFTSLSIETAHIVPHSGISVCCGQIKHACHIPQPVLIECHIRTNSSGLDGEMGSPRITTHIERKVEFLFQLM